MANYNRVILAGNLTRDPQLTVLPNNTPVCEFGLAINRRWRGQDGQNRDETCFVDCRLYGPQAETFNQYMSKGQPVLIEGRLQFQQWTTQEGDKRSKHAVVVDNFTFLGGRGGEGGGPPADAATETAPADVATGTAPAGAGATTPAYEEPPPPPGDGIPF